MSDLRPAGEALLQWALETGFLDADGQALVQDHLERLARGETILPPGADWAIAKLSLATLEPGYRCAICRDVGQVRRDVPVGHPDFGKPQPCRCQTADPAWEQAQWRRRLEHAQLPDRLGRCTLDTFARRVGTGQGWEAVQAVLAAARGGEPLPWVVLYGGLGSGKTHLLASLAQALLVTRAVAWADTGDLLDRCKANGFAQADTILAGVIECPLLFLDEFGSQAGDDWGRIRLERIVNKRLEAARPTFLGMTMLEPELKQWSPRIADRFADAREVRTATLLCESYRRTSGAEGAA